MSTSRKRRAAAARAVRRRSQRHERAERQDRTGALVEFLDGSGALAGWFLPRLESAAAVGIRTGWLSAAGIEAILPALVRVLKSDGTVMIVANAPEDMTDAAAYRTLADLVARFPDRMAVVLAAEVFQHGKVYYIRDRNGGEAAYVGSANLTGAGLEHNHETGVAFSNGESVIRQAAESVTAWWGHPAARWLNSAYLPGEAVRAVDAPEDWPAIPAWLRPGDPVTVEGRPGVVLASDRVGSADTMTVLLDDGDGPPYRLSALFGAPASRAPDMRCAARRTVPIPERWRPTQAARSTRDAGGRAMGTQTAGRMESTRRYDLAAPTKWEAAGGLRASGASAARGARPSPGRPVGMTSAVKPPSIVSGSRSRSAPGAGTTLPRSAAATQSEAVCAARSHYPATSTARRTATRQNADFPYRPQKRRHWAFAAGAPPAPRLRAIRYRSHEGRAVGREQTRPSDSRRAVERAIVSRLAASNSSARSRMGGRLTPGT